MKFKRYLFFITLFLLVSFFVYPREYSILEEEKFGEKIAKEIEKEYKILNIPEKTELMQKICEEIGKNTERKGIKYKVKIIDETEINAFSIPGGYIYVNRRVLDFIESDDELAGVLAHEIAHIVHQHSLKKLEKDKKLLIETSLGALLGIITIGKNEDVAPIIAAANAIRIDTLSGYGRKMEEEADRSAINYLSKTKYTPFGYLTFMEKLLSEEKRRPSMDAGIFKTHPDTEERIKNVIFFLKKLNITPEETKKYKVDIKDGEIFINDTLIFKPLIDAEGISKEERAQKYAKNIKGVIDKKIRISEWHLVSSPFEISLIAGGEKILTIYKEEADLQNTSLEKMANQIFQRIRKIFWEEFSGKIY